MAQNKSKVCNNKCLCVQFPNINNTSAVAFQSWLKQPVDDADLEKMIENGDLVQLYWPSNVEIKSASYMNKSLPKISEEQWEMRVTKILSFGG